MVFSSSHVWMWELVYKESWAPKNWCFWTVVLEKTLESPLDCKEIEPVHPKGRQSWIFIGRTDANTEASTLWPPDWKKWLIGKDPDAWKDWRQEEKGTTEDEMVGWHHWLNGHEFEQASGDGDGQGSLVCCSPWGSKEQLNWTGHDWATDWTDIYMYHIFIYSSLDGYLGCFCVLAIVNSTPGNIGLHVSFWIKAFIFSGYMPRSGATGQERSFDGISKSRIWVS